MNVGMNWVGPVGGGGIPMGGPPIPPPDGPFDIDASFKGLKYRDPE